MKIRFQKTLEQFLLSLRPEDSYEENRAGMNEFERLYEELFCKKPVEKEKAACEAA
jgi:hypothetical protein